MPLHFIRLHSSLLFLLTSATVSCFCSDAAHAQEAATAPRYRAFALRLGGNIGSTLGPMVGLDFTVPQWSIGRGFVTRFTLESVFNSRRGSLQSTVQPIFFMTVDQVYSKPGADRQPYFGVGVGIYSGPLGKQTGSTIFGDTYKYEQGIGGKAFVGVDLTSTTGLEAAAHFTQDFTLTTFQFRVKF